MNTLNRRKFKRAGMYALIILSVVILAFPLYWMIVTSLTTRSALLENISILPKPKNITSSNFMKILDSQPILTWFGNSIFVTAFSTIIAITVSTMAAYSMSRYKYKSTNFLGFFLLVVRMLPETLLVVPLYMMFTHMKLINNYASLIISNITFIIPFSTWMMKGYFDSIPNTLEEAARIDGCSRLQAVRKIVIPLATPGIAATSTYSAILGWSEFLFARTFITRPDKWTVTVGISSLMGEYTIIWGEVMAAAAISIIPIALVFIFLEKYMVAGVTAGAVKG
ncbi:carbohydrate ABC transporter membrane protein 2 (CUT1 family) [Muricomes intestini]|uniref:Carbohydrate ABC transporter membrane protein 2 (CUT1 family) n=1 Tax=Muricomes intestini TaxID=1796634 RepID=A0A4R3K1A9_9FIRM|nr:carbohydrate ABC transporter permease [Muricomes intestini]TCS75033.1 carbohydrate ABC transporter membrane protein 2 (CUT1 family) [Muricomes intestini]